MSVLIRQIAIGLFRLDAEAPHTRSRDATSDEGVRSAVKGMFRMFSAKPEARSAMFRSPQPHPGYTPAWPGKTNHGSKVKGLGRLKENDVQTPRNVCSMGENH